MKYGANLMILSVVPRIVLPVYLRRRPFTDELVDSLKDAHKSFLTEAKTKVNNVHPKIEFVTRLGRGRPSHVIVEVAKEEDVDLIVIGSRGLGGISGWVLGSTSRNVVNSATKPVLITK